jgi:exosortase
MGRGAAVGGRKTKATTEPMPLAHMIAAIALIAVAFWWVYDHILIGLWHTWMRSDDYSVGALVPPAALFLVWHYRKRLAGLTGRPCLAGIAVILIAQLIRLLGLVGMYESVERYSAVLTICGIVLLLAGWTVFFRLRWVMLFLFLAVPPPARVHNRISGPLQESATSAAVFLLEILGVTVDRTGYVVVLNDSVPLAVEEACSGLRMLTAFMVVAAVMAFLANRPTWQKVTLFISSVPIAILCNLIRLVVTALLYLSFDSQVAESFFHDFAGVTMMPLAVFMLLGELWLLRVLFPAREAGTHR